jgi:hypothetical protein
MTKRSGTGDYDPTEDSFFTVHEFTLNRIVYLSSVVNLLFKKDVLFSVLERKKDEPASNDTLLNDGIF